MRTKPFYYSMILLFLFAAIIIGCDKPNISDEVNQEETELSNKHTQTIEVQSIEVERIKIPAGG